MVLGLAQKRKEPGHLYCNCLLFLTPLPVSELKSECGLIKGINIVTAKVLFSTKQFCLSTADREGKEAKKNGTEGQRKCALFPTMKRRGVQDGLSQKNTDGDWAMLNLILVYLMWSLETPFIFRLLFPSCCFFDFSMMNTFLDGNKRDSLSAQVSSSSL